MAWQPSYPYAKKKQYAYRPTTRVRPSVRGYAPSRQTHAVNKVPVKVRVTMKDVIYKGSDWNTVKAILKHLSPIYRQKGKRLEVIGNPDDPNHGDFIVRVVNADGSGRVQARILKIG